MTALDYVKTFSELGAVGVLAVVVYLFCTGRIMSEISVSKLMEAQANHIGDLKNVMGKKLDKVIDLLDEIRENGAMNQKR